MFKWMMMPPRGHRLAVMRFCASVRPSAGALPNASQRQRQHSPEASPSTPSGSNAAVLNGEAIALHPLVADDTEHGGGWDGAENLNVPVFLAVARAVCVGPP